MGLFSSKSKTKNKVHRTPEFDRLGSFVLGQAPSVFGQGYKPYTEERFSPFTSDDLAGFDLARGFADPESYNAQIERQALDKFVAPPELSSIEPYMNPFIQGVLDRATYNTTRAFDARKAKLDAQQASGGSFGGSRFAVAQGELEDSYLDTLADLHYKGLSDAFDQGIDRYYRTGIDAMNLSQLSNKSTADRFNTLLNIGGAQRQLSQQEKDFDYLEFLRSIKEPKDNLLSAGSLLSSYPVQSFDTTQTTKKSPSILQGLQGIAGLAGAVAGIPGVGSIFGGGGGSGISTGGSTIFGGGGITPALQGINTGFSIPSTTPMSFGTYSVNPAYYNPSSGYKDGGLVKKKNPFERKITGVSREKNVTLDKNPFKSKTSNIKIEKPLQFADGGSLVPFDATGGVSYSNILRNIESTGPSGKKTSFEDILSNYRTVPKNLGWYKNKPTTKSPDLEESLGVGSSEKTDRYVNPFNSSDYIIPTEPDSVEQVPEKQSWMDRWMENPLTQIGIALMKGSGPDVLGGFGEALDSGYQSREAEETRQRELEHSQQINAANELQRRKEAMAALEVQKQRYSNDYKIELEKINQMRSQTNLAKADKYTRDLVDLYEKNTGTILGYQELLADPANVGADTTDIKEAIKRLHEENAIIMDKFKSTVGFDTVKRFNPETGKIE